jgi:hypothetical protein
MTPTRSYTGGTHRPVISSPTADAVSVQTVSDKSLAYTGASDLLEYILVGGGLLAVGSAFILVGRSGRKH